jgi:uncharacterized protein YggU (UPF0235/DUF167 family)
MPQTDADVVITVRVTPRSQPGIEARGDTLLIRVAAPPVEGRATEEARRALAHAVGVPPSRVALVSGGRSRTKRFRISGLTPLEVTAALTGRR